MKIDLSQYTKPPAIGENPGGVREYVAIWNKGGVWGIITVMVQRAIEWAIVKYIAWALLVAILGLFAKSIPEDKLERISADVASGGYWAAITELFTSTGLESETLNAHPAYKYKGIIEIEKDLGISFKKVFWLVNYKGHDYFLMRKPLDDAKGNLIKADKFNFVFDDAESICSKYGGMIPNKDMVEKAAKKFNLIKRPQGTEMFIDSDVALGYFRCVVDPRDFQEAE